MENGIRRAEFSDKNKSIIFAFERELSLKELSIPRIEKHLSNLKKVGEKISKDFDRLDKDDTYDFLAWLHRSPDILDWAKKISIPQALLRFWNSGRGLSP